MKLIERFILLLAVGLLGLFFLPKAVDCFAANPAKLDVPLENQNEDVKLGNGCEITALSMLLRYYGYQTNKNQLAEKLTYVPVKISEELYGNPHDGFVGDITGGNNAMGVGVEPIAQVATEIVQKDHQVVGSTTTDFAALKKIVTQGTPVWVVTTVDFTVPQASDFRYWETTSGIVKVSPLCHAVVITGIDHDTVYVNDPYGYKNRTVNQQDFAQIYQAMGQQSLYLK